ncbi:MAG: hypothetical protein JXR78_04215 [Victivallales bacterium]|nr:hypothetical protein [Victivallales bacterium]
MIRQKEKTNTPLKIIKYSDNDNFLKSNPHVFYGYLIKTILSITVLFTVLSDAKAYKYPIFADQKLSRPTGLRHILPNEIQVNIEHVSRHQPDRLFSNPEALKKLAEFYRDTPEGLVEWRRMTGRTAEILNNWDFRRKGLAGARYTYRVRTIADLAICYLLSGHMELGQFIRGHTLLAASLPIEFWLHSELRGYDSGKPLGKLETAMLSSAIAMTLSLAGDLFAPEEKIQVKNALKQKGLIPCMNWINETTKKNNFVAVICSGAYITARYFGEYEGMKKARQTMSKYLNSSIEPDGSYGEGLGYFVYPISEIARAVVFMSPEEQQKTFASSGLRFSAQWQAYPYFYLSDREKRPRPYLIHFSDNSCYQTPTVIITQAVLFRDGIAMWLHKKFQSPINWLNRLFMYSQTEKLPEPQSPAKLGLPLIKTFDNGDNFIRSSWDDNSIVLGLRSGNGSRIEFSHQRPELNSICMGAYGEYLIVSPGSASYRSPLRYLWDMATRSANTISIDSNLNSAVM